MMQDPNLHEKIFKRFTCKLDRLGLEAPEDLESPGIRNSPDRLDAQRTLIKRLMYFFGPYVKTKTGETLYEKTYNTKDRLRKTKTRL